MDENGFDLGQSPGEVARRLGVHIATVYRWMYSTVRGRNLKSYLLGGRRRIRTEDLDLFLEREQPSGCGNSEAERDRKAQSILEGYRVARTEKRKQG